MTPALNALKFLIIEMCNSSDASLLRLRLPEVATLLHDLPVDFSYCVDIVACCPSASAAEVARQMALLEDWDQMRKWEILRYWHPMK